MNYSKITDFLYIGTTPKADDYSVLHDLGIDLVINMRIGLPPRHDPHNPPMKSLWLPTIDSPFIPIPLRALIKGAEEALKFAERQGLIYTHCSKGRHRGPAMGACILIARGMTAQEAIALIKQQRPASDPQVWYIKSRIMKFERYWTGRR